MQGGSKIPGGKEYCKGKGGQQEIGSSDQKGKN
jgi:hypothetical protein